MDWTWFLFSFKGRINRAKGWLAGLIIVCWMTFWSGLIAGIGKLFGGPASGGTSQAAFTITMDQHGEIEFSPRSAGPPPEWHVKRRHG
jgi:uncharacterized membrane protein YhaH (DUF805 family)